MRKTSSIPLALLAALLGALAAFPASAQAEMEAGFGRRSLVSERRDIPLGGYGGRGLIPFHSVHDPVYAKAMVLRSGGKTLTVVALDLIGTQRTILEALRTRGFPERVRIDPDALLVTATHVHSSYGGLAKRTGAIGLDALFVLTCGPFRKDFFDEVVDKVRAAIVDAWDDLQPARFGVASGAVEGLARNRGRGGDVTDDEVTVLQVAAPDGRVRGLLVNLTAHPVIVGGELLMLSAGFPGALADDLERRHEGATVLVTNGAEGDQSIRVPQGDYRNDFEKIDATGRHLAEHVERIRASIRPKATLAIATRSEELRMPTPSALEHRVRHAVGLKRSLFFQATLDDALLMGCPGEPCCRIGLDLKREARARGFRHPIVIGLAQDHCGYFVHRHDYGAGFEASHDYEKSLNFYGPEISDFLVDVHIRRFDPRPLGAREERKDRPRPTGGPF